MHRIDEQKLTKALGSFLHGRERVLICLPEGAQTPAGKQLAEAVEHFGAVPEFWSEDHRWMGLLRQAFASRAVVVVGDPLLILGLRKVAKATHTPLFIRHVVLLGPSTRRLKEDLCRSLDCRIWDITEQELEPDVLTRQLLPWSSILDFRARQTPLGLDLEIVVFPGEKLPQLPSCAKMNLRKWEPEKDVPFSLKT